MISIRRRSSTGYKFRVEIVRQQRTNNRRSHILSSRNQRFAGGNVAESEAELWGKYPNLYPAEGTSYDGYHFTNLINVQKLN